MEEEPIIMVNPEVDEEMEDPLSLEDLINSDNNKKLGPIQMLVKVPFLDRPDSVKYRIYKEGRPKPETLGNKTWMYSSYPWVALCENTGQVYCWYCLLFGEIAWVFPNDGDVDESHRWSTLHLTSSIRYAKFGEEVKRNESDAVEKVVAMEDDLTSRRNFEVIKRVIDVVGLLVRQRLTIKGNYNAFLSLLKPYDHIIEDHLCDLVEKSFDATHTNVQVGMMVSIQTVLKQTIARQVEEATHVALIHYSGGSTDFYLILQYIHKTRTKRRCVDFWNNEVADVTVVRIKKIINDYHLEKKLSMIVYDGSAFKSLSIVSEIHEKLGAMHVPYIFGRTYMLDFLSIGLSDVSEFQNFLLVIRDLINFGEGTQVSIKTFLKVKLEYLDDSWWPMLSKMLCITDDHRKDICNYLEAVHREMSLDIDLRATALGYCNFLKHFRNALQLRIYSLFVAQLGVLFEEFKLNGTSVRNLVNKIMCGEALLQQFSYSDYEAIRDEILLDIQTESSKRPKTDTEDENWPLIHLINANICSNLQKIAETFNSIKHFDLIHDDIIFANIQPIPVELLHSQPDCDVLKNEIVCLQKFRNDFKGKPIHLWLEELGVDGDFERTVRLSRLVETVSDRFVFEGGCKGWSTLRRMFEVPIYDTNGVTVYGDSEDMFVYFNGDLLEELRGKERFYQEVSGKLREVLKLSKCGDIGRECE